MTRDERGAGTLLVIAVIGVLVAFTLVCGAIASLVSVHRTAQGAADLAALAGAGAVGAGKDPCSAATAIARRNHARITGCAVRGFVVDVEVVARTPRFLGARRDLRARARAGPAGDGSLEQGPRGVG